MNQYLEVAQLFLPTKFSNYISITKTAYEIINIASSKFRPEFQSVKNAQNYQIDDPTLYSQLFQGSFNLETIKRKSISLNQSCLKDIQDFLSNYQFTQQLNIIKICKEFYSEKYGCCILNLKTIAQDFQNYVQNNVIQTFNDEQLNQSIDELSLLFIEYIKGQFNQEQIIEQFYTNFQDISTTVYQQIIQAAKRTNEEIYKNLVKSIKQFYKKELINQILEQICTLIKENNIPLYQVKYLIQNYFVQNSKYLHDELQNFYNFQLSNVIIQKYAAKILEHQLFKIRNSLQIYMIHEKVNYGLQQKCIQLFNQYFQKKDFLLIKNKDFASQMFYLLLQVDLQSQEFSKILDILSQYTQITNFDSSNDFQQNLIKLKETYSEQIAQANAFWKNTITEQQNLELLFDLFIMLNGTHFLNDQLLLSQYLTINKNILMKIINLMKDGYYHYFNCNLIKKFENIIGDIRYQIVKQLQNKDQEVKLYIKIQENQFIIQIYDKNDLSQQLSQQQFYQRNALYYFINDSKIEDQTNQLKILLKDIQRDYLKNFEIPERFQFERRSPQALQSSIINLFISGFTDQDVQNNLLEGLKDYNVIVLNWNNPKEDNNVKEKLLEAVKQVILKSPLEAISSGLKALTSAPFEKCCQEAKKVGRYLAHLIIQKKIFGDCQINIIAHSVGSTVMYEMMKELDSISNNKYIINEILILGGIVDIRKLQKRRWNCVEGRICNVYSKNDMVIKLIYNSFRWLDQFCGLNEVKLGYKRIENYNLSSLIKGHNDYGVHVQQILVNTDFLQYLKFLYE